MLESLGKPFEHLVDFLKTGRHAVAAVAGTVWAGALLVLAVPNQEVENVVSTYRGWLWIAFYFASAALLMCAIHWVWDRRQRRRNLAELVSSLTPGELSMLGRFVEQNLTTLQLPSDFVAVRLLCKRGLLEDLFPVSMDDFSHYQIRTDVLEFLKQLRPPPASGT